MIVVSVIHDPFLDINRNWKLKLLNEEIKLNILVNPLVKVVINN